MNNIHIVELNNKEIAIIAGGLSFADFGSVVGGAIAIGIGELLVAPYFPCAPQVMQIISGVLGTGGGIIGKRIGGAVDDSFKITGDFLKGTVRGTILLSAIDLLIKYNLKLFTRK